MAVTRYKEALEYINAVAGYKKTFPKRFNENGIRQLPINTLKYPTLNEAVDFEVATKIWSVGDRFYKLATTYYNSPEYWWVIALYNKKPTEHHVKLGEIIEIPLPLESVLSSYGL